MSILAEAPGDAVGGAQWAVGDACASGRRRPRGGVGVLPRRSQEVGARHDQGRDAPQRRDSDQRRQLDGGDSAGGRPVEGGQSRRLGDYEKVWRKGAWARWREHADEWQHATMEIVVEWSRGPRDIVAVDFFSTLGRVVFQTPAARRFTLERYQDKVRNACRGKGKAVKPATFHSPALPTLGVQDLRLVLN